MNFINTTTLNRLLVFLGLLFLSAYFPIKALALSADSQQHFTLASTSQWVVTSGGNAYALHLGSTNVDPNDVSAQNAGLWAALPATTGVTVTYTDPAPANPQNFIEIDINTTTLAQNIEIIATDVNNISVTATYGSQDIILSCQATSPATQNNTQTFAETTPQQPWNIAFINVSALAAVKSVQFIFQDTGNMNPPGGGGGTIYLDNLRGQSYLTCANTPTNTATNTPGGNTPTFTNTPVNTATNTPTVTPTNTPSGPTPTFTNTPTVTSTFTITLTPTPGPCQPEVYPNPMDFTASGSILNCPNGNCIVFSCLPLNATMKIYTVSLSLVRVFPQGSVMTGSNLLPGVGYIPWDGTNGNNSPVASGLYFYVVNSPNGNTFGKFAISKSKYGH